MLKNDVSDDVTKEKTLDKHMPVLCSFGISTTNEELGLLRL